MTPFHFKQWLGMAGQPDHEKPKPGKHADTEYDFIYTMPMQDGNILQLLRTKSGIVHLKTFTHSTTVAISSEVAQSMKAFFESM